MTVGELRAAIENIGDEIPVRCLVDDDSLTVLDVRTASPGTRADELTYWLIVAQSDG